MSRPITHFFSTMNTRQVHEWNETAAIGCALFLNSLLVFCVLIEKEKFLRWYKNVILFSCFSEFLFVAISIYVRPQVIFVSNALLIVANGRFLQDASQLHVNVAVGFFVWSVCYDCTKLLIEFTTRWQIVCNGTMPTIKRLFCLTAAVYVGTSVQVVCLSSGFSFRPEDRWAFMFEDEMWKEGGRMVRFAASESTFWGTRVFVCLATVAIVFTYSVIFWCSRRITAVLDAQSAIFSARTQQLQRGLTWMLFMQAIVPLVVSIVPGILSLVAMLSGVGSSAVSFVISSMLPWTPTVGPAFTLLCVPNYRARIFGLCCWRARYKRNSIFAVGSQLRSSRFVLPADVPR